MNENTKAILLVLIAGLSLFVAIISSFIAIRSYSRLSNQDLKNDTAVGTKVGAVVETKLDYISKGMDDIKLDNREQSRVTNGINSRLIAVEESSKSAHKRIDELKK